MPPSARKAKTRARRTAAVADAPEPSDAETPETITTPSRASRKRARAADPVPAPAARNTRRKTKDTRGVDREDTEATEAQDGGSDNDTEPALLGELEIIASLRVAERQVNATEDFANDLLEGQENVPGYGKIAGRDWAFIIRKVEVNIGRPEAHERLQADENVGQGGAGTPSHKTVVDIDLGPDRQVSRSHAVIVYDAENASWFIIVNGRNGLRVDNNLLKRGMKSYLRNGSVIEIANTQMAFITTATEDSDGPVWDATIIRQAQKSSEEDEDGAFDGDGRSHAHPVPQRGQLSGTSRLPVEYNTQSSQQGQHRAHPHSNRAAALMNGGPLPPGTPSRGVNGHAIKSSPSASYGRGHTAESTESSIDYSSSTAKDLKPPHSYAQLIGMAILSTHEQQMTLNNIYKWIMANYAFYRFNTGGWQNSIRHNLSLNKAFTKIARRTDEPGKGMKWMIAPDEFDTFVSQGMKGCRRPVGHQIPAGFGTQSTLPSPSSSMAALRHRAPGSGNGLRRAEADVSPPFMPYQTAYPAVGAREAATPDRASRQNFDPSAFPDARSVGLGIHESQLDSTQDAADSLGFLRSTPRNGLTAAANAAGSPPALYVNDEGRVGVMDTPFPLRPTARFAPPSTLRRPSDFIQFSSPAPFWKMDGLVGSTPWKPYDLSPLKTPFPLMKPKTEPPQQDVSKVAQTSNEGSTAVLNATQPDPEVEVDAKTNGRAGSPVIPSSSPPRVQSTETGFSGSESPSASRPATSGGSKALDLLAAAGVEAEASAGAGAVQPPQPPTASFSGRIGQPEQPTYPRSASQQTNGNGHHIEQPYHLSAPPMSQHVNQNGYAPSAAMVSPQDDEEEGIDLAKGFQPIGSFHQAQHNHLAGVNGLGSAIGVGGPVMGGVFGR
ncbi:hypothetical protein B0A48_13508 [Cryoendolithus antarcticus]|uniref:Fork-head transcriptional regulator 2 n=1 Tax=Cryoendolithus antarcticus TaxID=1507870 RepID=A0A1V8SPB5_9PEZI|nr:hypothetical protein B0A48_13508 [Cryoendolithus antarcticus]